MEKPVKKTKFVWSIILCILAFAPIGLAIYVLLIPLPLIGLIESTADLSFVVTMSLLLGFGLMFVAHILYALYKNARGRSSVSGKIYYWLTLIFSVPFFIIMGVYGLIRFAGEKMQEKSFTPSSDSSESKNKKYEINVNGYKRDIEWDQYTKTYRDTSGNHYTTKDGGKTFSKKN